MAEGNNLTVQLTPRWGQGRMQGRGRAGAGLLAVCCCFLLAGVFAAFFIAPKAVADGCAAAVHFRSVEWETITPAAAACVDARATDDNGWTALHLAAGYSANPQVIKTLLDGGAKVNAASNGGWRPLHLAAGSGKHPPVAEMLLAHGADINGENGFGGTPLHSAASAGKYPAMIETLLLHGAKVNAENIGGWRPLHQAAASGKNPQVIETLLARGAAVNAADGEGNTPLHYAASQGENYAAVKAILLAHGADAALKNNKGQTAADLAAAR